MTYSPIRSKLGPGLISELGINPQEVTLHELSSSTDMEKIVGDFYGTANETSGQDQPKLLLVHADPAAASLRMIEHCRFVCEKARNDMIGRINDPKAKEVVHEAGVFVIIVVHL